jgi:glycine/D-amino acid oxidase-like deaminating enzyme
MPQLTTCQSVPVNDADQCSYDLTVDNDFIIGQLPGFQNIYLGCGWNGTGYKFAPLVGTMLSELALEGKTNYDISRFNPNRFYK